MSFLQIIFISFVLVGATLAEIQCGPNEVLDKCPSDCPYDYCPKNELQDQTPCPKPQTCPPPKCKCGFNYRRENGTCIPTTDCPPFPCERPRERFVSCPSYCPGQDCSSATPTGECPFFMLIAVSCSPSCRCIPGHWRKDGLCVPYVECLS